MTPVLSKKCKIKNNKSRCKPGRKLECKFCDKKFIHRLFLVLHEATDHAQRWFVQNGCYYPHQIHRLYSGMSESQEFAKCTICESEFEVNRDWLLHRKNVHKLVIPPDVEYLVPEDDSNDHQVAVSAFELLNNLNHEASQSESKPDVIGFIKTEFPMQRSDEPETEKKFPCTFPYCNCGYETQRELRYHARSHIGQVPFCKEEKPFNFDYVLDYERIYSRD